MGTVYVDSVEYVRVRVSAEEAGVEYDPTSDTVYMAFITSDQDEDSATWTQGDWETVGGKYYARVLRGVDPVLAEGRYTVLIKVVTAAETIIRPCGTLIVE